MSKQPAPRPNDPRKQAYTNPAAKPAAKPAPSAAPKPAPAPAPRPHVKPAPIAASATPARRPGRRGDLDRALPAPGKAPKNPTKAPLEARIASTGDAARDAAAAHLALQAEVFPNLDLRELMLPPGLDSRDAALAHAIVDAAIKRWTTLERLIAKGCKQPLSKLMPTVRGALLCAAAQVVLLERVPAHAALNHAVEWTKLSLDTPSSGLVNAVLRRVVEAVGAEPQRVPLPPEWWMSRRHIPLADGRALVLTSDILPEDDAHRLGVQTGLPRAVLTLWIDSLGIDVARRLALHAVQPAPAIINSEAAPTKPDADTIAHQQPSHLVWKGTPGGLRAWLDAHPRLWVQDPASAHVVRYLRETITAKSKASIKTIADLCAGQGTKTRQLAHHFPDAQIIATDIDTARRRTLAASFVAPVAAAGSAGTPPAGGVRTVEHAALAAYSAWADLVLLDVPCSNTGVIARRPEAKYRFADHTLGQLIAIQRDILTQGRALLKGPGSLLAYSTCSLDPRENREMATWACNKLGLELVADDVTLPGGSPTLGPDAARHYTDASYVALMRLK